MECTERNHRALYDAAVRIIKSRNQHLVVPNMNSPWPSDDDNFAVFFNPALSLYTWEGMQDLIHCHGLCPFVEYYASAKHYPYKVFIKTY